MPRSPKPSQPTLAASTAPYQKSTTVDAETRPDADSRRLLVIHEGGQLQFFRIGNALDSLIIDNLPGFNVSVDLARDTEAFDAQSRLAVRMCLGHYSDTVKVVTFCIDQTIYGSTEKETYINVASNKNNPVFGPIFVILTDQEETKFLPFPAYFIKSLRTRLSELATIKENEVTFDSSIQDLGKIRKCAPVFWNRLNCIAATFRLLKDSVAAYDMQDLPPRRSKKIMFVVICGPFHIKDNVEGEHDRYQPNWMSCFTEEFLAFIRRHPDGHIKCLNGLEIDVNGRLEISTHNRLVELEHRNILHLLGGGCIQQTYRDSAMDERQFFCLPVEIFMNAFVAYK